MMTIEQMRIKQKRFELKRTQKEMADMLGITQQAYQQLETGRTTDMRISTLKRLCCIFDVSADWLMGRDAEGESDTNTEIKALDVINYIHRLSFTSYNDFLQKAIKDEMLLNIKKELGEMQMYKLVCQKCGESPNEEYIEALAYNGLSLDIL